MYPTRFSIILLGFFIAALIFGTFLFLKGMGDASYLVSNGARVGLHYLDKPKYDIHFQGLIFTLTFLAAGLLLLLLIILPDQRAMAMSPRSVAPPQPRRRPGTQPPAPPQAVAAPEPHYEPPPTPEMAPSGTTVEIEGEANLAAPFVPETPRTEKRSLDEEVLRAQQEAAQSLDDIPDTRGDDTGEEDVVYGTGRVTDDAIWEFIHEYPDSAVKFLYRKTLENKGLAPTEEDIYRRWEMRGMSRAKIREFVLEIMRWKSLPDEFPHNIWRSLRDQIFEIRSKNVAA